MLIFEKHKFDSQIKIWHHLSFWFHCYLYGTHNVCMRVRVRVQILSKCYECLLLECVSVNASECELLNLLFPVRITCQIYENIVFQYKSHATQSAERETIK